MLELQIKSQELNAIFKQAWLIKNKDNKDSEEYNEFKSIIEKLPYGYKKEKLVEMVLDNGLDMTEILYNYNSVKNTKDTQRKVIQDLVVDELNVLISERVSERIKDGEWDTSTDKYISDEERDRLLQEEADAYEDENEDPDF